MPKLKRGQNLPIQQDRRTNLQIAQDRKEIAKLYLQGMTQASIAEKLNLSPQTVSRDIRLITKEWTKVASLDLGKARQKELARIDALELEYWAEWERSKEETKSQTAKRVSRGPDKAKGGQSEKDKTPAESLLESTAIVKTEERLGNPVYLAGIQRCIEIRVKLLGLNVPEKVENYNFDFSKLSDEELNQLLDRLDGKKG